MKRTIFAVLSIMLVILGVTESIDWFIGLGLYMICQLFVFQFLLGLKP